MTIDKGQERARRGNPFCRAGYVHERFRKPKFTGFADLRDGGEDEDKYDLGSGDENDAENYQNDQTYGKPLDLTRPTRIFDHRNFQPTQQRPYKPRRYPRGQITKNMIDRDFRFSKGKDKLWVDDEETRVWIQEQDVGMIIGFRWTRKQELEEEFGVEIKIPRAVDGDQMVGVIISGDRRHECKNRIEDILSGRFRDPPENDDSEEEPDFDNEHSAHQEGSHSGARSGSADVHGEDIICHDRPANNVESDLIKEILHPDVEARSLEENQKWQEENNQVKVEALSKSEKEVTIAPSLTFEEAFYRFPEISETIEAHQDFTTPTPIQSQLWPIALRGRDCIGISQPGSGKTLGFLAPLIAHVKYGGVFKEKQRIDEESDFSQTERNPDIRNKIRLCDLETPSALVIAPTRELAEQIERQIQTFFTNFVVEEVDGKKIMFRSAVFTGGRRKEDQEMILRSNEEFPHLVVGTPGRLKDLLGLTAGSGGSESLDLRNVTFVVLDEADRMLDQGFRPDIKAILRNRQTVMTSATWNKDVHVICAQFLRKPIKVLVGEMDTSIFGRVTQEIIKVSSDHEKLKELMKIIKSLNKSDETKEDESDDDDDNFQIQESAVEEEILPEAHAAPAAAEWGSDNENGNGNGWDAPELESGQNNWDAQEEISAVPERNPNFGAFSKSIARKWKMIVFCSQRITVDELFTSMIHENVKDCVKMHGEHDQRDRDIAIDKFRSGRAQILVATDVAGRGIDVDDVTHVFNYDMPVTHGDYIHRCGRTGRAGRSGSTYTIFNKSNRRDQELADDLFKSVEGGSDYDEKKYKWLKRVADKVRHQKELDEAAGVKKKTFRY